MTTRVLAEAIAETEAPGGLLADNGIVLLRRPRRVDVLTEESESRGRRAAHPRHPRVAGGRPCPQREAGARVCVLRTAPVMDRASVAPQAAAPLFRLRRSAPGSASGEQYFPIISLRDWIGATTYLAESRDVSGAFNLCCPRTPTNREFTEALASALHRTGLPRRSRRAC